VKATNFLLSFLIIVAAFAAGRYAFPTSIVPASAPQETAVKTTETPVVNRADSPAFGTISAEDALAYTPSELHTIRLFENASPSVCYITTKTQRRSFWTRDVSEVPAGSGSGFVWDNQGHIITNYHVIRDASRAIVTLANGEDYEAKLVGIAKEKDLAVLRIEAPARALQPIPVGTSQDIRVGQAVYAIGNPFGLDQTLTTGVVSALDREINSQANVPIRGVIQSIPVDVVRYVVPDLIRYGEVRRASLGVDFYRYWRGTGLAIDNSL